MIDSHIVSNVLAWLQRQVSRATATLLRERLEGCRA
jgi:hypothetical protein